MKNIIIAFVLLSSCASAQNVGIGTIAPVEKLDVRGTVKAYSFKMGNLTLLQAINTVNSFPALNSANIVCDGNSITQWGYPEFIASNDTLNLLCNVINIGVGGENTLDMIRRSGKTDSLFKPGVTNIIIANEIASDVHKYYSAVGAYNNFKFYCEARKARGFKVFVIPATPRWYNIPEDSNIVLTKRIDSANAMLKANWPSFADGYIDVLIDGRLLNTKDTKYWTDPVHPSDEGDKIIAYYVTKKIFEIFQPKQIR